MSKNLLIVDDEPDILSILETLLEESVDKIFMAKNGEEGLKIFKKEKIDYIISDLSMPVMDGMAFIVEIRKLNEDVPFIFLSAFGSPETKTQAREHGAFDFIEKSDFEEIESILQKAINA